MKSTSLRMKLLSGMLCTGLALSSGSVSFAVSQNENLDEKLATSMDFRVAVDKEKVEGLAHEQMNDTLEIVIKDSVRSNIITVAEGDKVLEYVSMKSKTKCKGNKKCRNNQGENVGLFNELVTAEILTKEKSDALKERMYLKKSEIRAEELQKGLNILVVNKVLTMEQKEKVQEALMASDAKRKENHQKMKDMTRKEKKDYIKELKKTEFNPMKVLIDNGTITKEQEKEIEKIIPNHKHHHGYMGK
jgi:hypothetical protein